MEGGLQKPTRFDIDWKNKDYLNEELFETQTKFLIDNSFLEIINDNINSLSLDNVKLKNLISPAFMGEAFKVIFFSKII